MKIYYEADKFTRWEGILKVISLIHPSSFIRAPFVVLFIFLLLTGCTSTPEEIPPHDLTHVNQIKNFEVSGKAAFISPNKKESVNFYWQQTGDDYFIRFTTFLGIEVAKITGGKKHIVIEADNEEYASFEPEKMLEEITGWKIPVRHLSKWLTGNAKGFVLKRYEDIDKPKRVLARVNADDEWQIDYNSYTPVHQLLLPNKIKLKKYKARVQFSLNKWVIK